MDLADDFRTILEQSLSGSEIDEFKSGDSALFVSEPKYAFFRIHKGEYQRADVVRDLDPEGDAQMRITLEAYPTTAEEVQERLENAPDIDVVPVEAGFGDN